MLQDLLPAAERIATLLKARRETIAIAESSTAGMVSAALLAVPGASAYFLGGAVVYTHATRSGLIGITDEAMQGLRASTEPYALLLARSMLKKVPATWCLSETGATGPAGNRYGDAAGHSCMAVVGPTEHAITLETGKSDRVENMRLFALKALELIEQRLA